MRELLVSYLLGELDEAQVADLEAKIADDPALQQELEKLRECLPCQQAIDNVASQDQSVAPPYDPPTGLADRTADSVHDLVLGLASKPVASTAKSDAPPRCTRSFTLVDAGVAAGVIMALGLMLLPALQESREASRRTACEYNLAQVGKALQQYAAAHGRLLPHVHPGENAGLYAVRLADEHFINREELTRMVVCRSSPLGQQVASRAVMVVVPPASELADMSPAQRAEARQLMGGSYAYRLGYLDGPLYRPIRMTYSSCAPMLSDAPNPVCGKWQSPNHGGYGQNVLFQDGHVRYKADCLLHKDNLFVNSAGKPAAGRKWNDVVLVGSDRTPGVLAAPGQPRQFKLKIWRITPR